MNSNQLEPRSDRSHELSGPLDPVEMRQPVDQTIDLLRLWTLLLKWRWLILFSIVCVVAPTMVFTFLSPPQYLATATIQIDPETAKVLPYRDVSDSLLNPTQNYELYMKTQDEALRSGALGRRVVARLEAERPEAVERFKLKQRYYQDFHIYRVSGSQVVKIGYASEDPEFSAAVANAVVEEFIKLYFERKSETTVRAREFLEGQLEDLKQRVEQAEAALIRYAEEHQILNVDNKDESVVRQRLGYLTNELAQVESEYLAKEAAFEGLADLDPEQLPESIKTPLVETLEGRVAELEQQLARLLSQFDENWPEVVKTRQELDLIRRQLARERQLAVSRSQKQAQLEFEAARREFVSLSNAFREQQQLVNNLNAASVQYNALKREVDTNEQLYQALLQRLKETGVTADLEFGNIHVTDSARPPESPYRPRPWWNFLLALLLGSVLGVAVAAVLEYVDNTIKSPEDLEALGVPSLGWVPVIDSGDDRPKLPHRRPAGRLEQSLKPIQSSLNKQENGHRGWEKQWRVWECFRMLGTSILLARGDAPPRTILITSPLPQEGKSTTVAYLGLALAEAGAKTLLIESDFRKPTLARRFEVSSSNGLSPYLAGGECKIQATFHPKLFLIPAGPTPPNPVALLNSSRFGKSLDVLTKKFQFVLVDSPPLLSLADASVIASKVDGVILVTRSGKTPRGIVKKAMTQLARAGATVLGATVNEMDLNSPEYSYYERYYFDRSYAGTGERNSPTETSSRFPTSDAEGANQG